MKDLPFNELVNKSNQLLADLRDDKASYEDIIAMLNEFTSRLQKESQSLHQSISQTKKQLNIPLLKIVEE